MTLMFDAAHKLATEQAIRVTIDDIDSLVVPLHGNEVLSDFLACVNKALVHQLYHPSIASDS